MAYSPITTHVLDTSLGKPARNLPIKLFYMTKDSTWAVIKQGNTNDDGRLLNLLTKEEFKTGYYKITFDTEAYFRAKDLSTFYPYVEVNYYYNLNDACNKLYCCKFSYCYLLLQTNKILFYIITRHIHDMSFLN